MYCRQCGTKLDDNAKFCGYCGTPVEQRQTPQPVVTPEPVVVPEPVAAPEPVVVVPEPVAAPEPAVVVPEPVAAPEPVVVVPEPVVEPEPVVVVPDPVVEPEPVVVVPEPVVEPEPVVVVPEPVVEPEPAVVEHESAANTEFMVIPETYKEQPKVEWQEPADEMEWQADAGEDVWEQASDNTEWQETNTASEQWSDTWSETAQTSGWNLQDVNEVPLIIEPKKRSVGLTIFTIIGVVMLTALIVVCAILMNGGKKDSYDDFWAFDYEDELMEDLEDELEDAFDEYSEFQEEYGEGAFLEESELVVETNEVSLSCGATIPFDAPSVDLSGMLVNDLYGLEQCTALQALRITGGSLTDLSPLADMTQLGSLTLNNVPVSDIQILKNLPNLTYLDITDTQVSSQQVKELQDVLPNLVVIGYTTSTYEITKKDCTWVEAVDMCTEKGGHLVTISDKAEMEKVEAALKGTELKYFWMGGYSQGDTWYWITGETWGGYENWFPGEPSKQDTDGTLEDCLCLWNVDDNGWTMNDQRNDLPSFTSTQGRIGYICEFESVAGYK